MHFRIVAFILIAAVLAGCANSDEELSIEPLAPAAGRVDPGLGPGTRALSSGPGYKGSPSWSPGGGRIAFTVDGYVVDKPAGPGDLRRLTTRDFVAGDTEWISDDTLMMLGAASGTEETPSSVYLARAGKDSLELEKVAKGVLAMSLGSDGLILALGNGTYESGLALANGSGDIYRLYTATIEGDVTALSPSPDGDEVVLAVRPPGDLETSELRVFDLLEGKGREITRLEGNQEILGTPQWTKHGVYFVAGTKDTSIDDDGAEPLYNLYRTSTVGGAPEPAPGVGEDFVAASIRVSPEGERLAVIGRLNPKSLANLYVLDIHEKYLRAMTTNEDMEIKTGPDDLAWSPGGKSVAIIARGTPSRKPEVRAAPASSLLKDFYNLYEIPVEGREESTR